MPLLVNNTEVENVIVNGTAVESVVVNGVEVFAPYPKYIIKNGAMQSGYSWGATEYTQKDSNETWIYGSGNTIVNEFLGSEDKDAISIGYVPIAQPVKGSSVVISGTTSYRYKGNLELNAMYCWDRVYARSVSTGARYEIGAMLYPNEAQDAPITRTITCALPNTTDKFYIEFYTSSRCYDMYYVLHNCMTLSISNFYVNK